MKRMTFIILAISLNLAQAETTVIYAGQLLAVPGEAPLSKQTIFIKDGVIERIEPGFVEFKQAGDMQLIQLRDAFVMPGLMDMHVHLQGELGPNNDRDALENVGPAARPAHRAPWHEHFTGRLHHRSRCGLQCTIHVRLQGCH